NHREVPDGGRDFFGALLCLSRRRVHPRDVPGRPAASPAAAVGQLCRASRVAAVLYDQPRRDRPAGAARAARGDDAERAAALGRTGLLPRPLGFFCADYSHVDRLHAHPQRPVVSIQGRDACCLRSVETAGISWLFGLGGGFWANSRLPLTLSQISAKWRT